MPPWQRQQVGQMDVYTSEFRELRSACTMDRGKQPIDGSTLHHKKQWHRGRIGNGGEFNKLGTFVLEAGTLEVVLSDTPSGYVIADAVQIVKQ